MDPSPELSHINPRIRGVKPRLNFGESEGSCHSCHEYESSAHSASTTVASRFGHDTVALSRALALIHAGSFFMPGQDGDLPWLDENGQQIWSTTRMQIYRMTRSDYFKNGMMVIIVFNLFLIIYETDQEAKCYPQYKDDLNSCPHSNKNILWVYVTNLILLSLYSVEAALVLFAERKDYFSRRVNWLDLGICIVGWISQVLGGIVNVSWLRILRASRLLRHENVRNVHELQLLVSGFGGSMKSMAFGAVFIFVGLVLSSILVVQYVHPSNVEIDYGDDCERCSRGYSSVFASTLTLFQQIVAGDSWGQLSIPNIETNWIGTILLPMLSFVVGLGVMNLILAVIVDCALQARSEQDDESFRRKIQEQKQRKTDLAHMFRSLDTDRNGFLDFKEVENAYARSDDFQKMMVHSGLHKAELIELFEYLDEDLSGSISYTELCNAFEDFTARDPRVLCALARINVRTLDRKVTLCLDFVTKLLTQIDGKLDVVVDGREWTTKEWTKTASMNLGARLKSKSSHASHPSKDSRSINCAVKTTSKASASSQCSSALKENLVEGDVSIPCETTPRKVEQLSAISEVLQRLNDVDCDIHMQLQQQLLWSQRLEDSLNSATSIIRDFEATVPVTKRCPLTPRSNEARSPCSITTPRSSLRFVASAPQSVLPRIAKESLEYEPDNFSQMISTA